LATPTPTPLDAERARLRAEGHTDAEISQILINKASGIGTPPQAGANFASGPQMPMAGVLGNANAVLSHARGTIPVVKENLANLSDGSTSHISRAKSAAILVGVAVIVAALGYAIHQEWQIHIVNAPITAAAQAQKAAAEAAVAASLAASEAKIKAAEALVKDTQKEEQAKAGLTGDLFDDGQWKPKGAKAGHTLQDLMPKR
jgi:hypothetical protein